MPFVRLRRLRRTSQIRELVSQTKLTVEDLIMPYFVIEGRNKKESIKSMPGIYRLSIDNLIEDIRVTRALGINAVLLFGICSKKDNIGSQAYAKNGIVQRTVKAVRKEIQNTVIITDVCLCGYTVHGHCGIVAPQSYIIDNDETIKILAKIALSHAQAGADFVAPSGMMDGQVKAIRETLDKNRFLDTGILAYSAKYASNFYGPFRQALDSEPKFGDRKGYQMDFRNSDEALREIKQDIAEGADIVMIKPALSYLDIISRARQEFNIPLAAYNVSGEYAMVKAYCQSKEQRASPKRLASPPRILAEKSKEEEKSLILEILTSIKRAGADLLITYHAKEVARWLKD